MGGACFHNNGNRGKLRRWTVPEIRSLGGGCALQVAAKLGRSPRAVQDKARSIGVEPPRMPHACYWPKATKDRALAMRSDGRSLASISRATGVPLGTLRHWVYGERNRGRCGRPFVHEQYQRKGE